MTCPKCRGEMRVYERSGVTIDQCTECRGIFLDRGELEKLFAVEANYNRPGAAQPGYAAPPPPHAPGGYAPPPPPPGYGAPAQHGYPPQPAYGHGPQYGHHGHYRQQQHHGHYRKRKGFLHDLFD